ncbi:SRPBCC domain-containing protein [Arthrobacter sp. GCM10027362]|uniref:SRPBCC domain-containing protein n=1 Tax=Arthrobacter sp. GCM10027362 TaxID=3273379 RepID=UPI003626BE8C
MLNLASVITAHERTLALAADGETYILRLSRLLAAPAEEVWDALTDPERVRLWFLPVSGDLRRGGSYQLEGSAGGDILYCDPGRRFTLTFGTPDNIVDVKLAADPRGGTRLDFENAAAFEMPEEDYLDSIGDFAPGWETLLAALDLHLRGKLPAGPRVEDMELWQALAHIWRDLARAMFAR